MELDRRIRDGEYPNCLTFSADWEVSQKTIQRDIDYLRDELGAPIQYDRVRKGFYYANPNWFLPSLSMSEGELLTLCMGVKALELYRGTPIAGELKRIFDKVTRLLPDRISIKPELVFNRFSFTTAPAKPMNEGIWTTIVRGVVNQQCVEITYRVFEGESSYEQVIMPYHIANLQGEWYVFGPYVGYDDVRQFSMARIAKAKLTRKHFDLPDEFDPADLLRATFGRYAGDGKPQTVRLLFDKDIAPWINERQWHPVQKVKKRKNGDIELSFPAKGLLEVQRWVLSWGHRVNVLSPKELKDGVEKEIDLMAKKKGTK